MSRFRTALINYWNKGLEKNKNGAFFPPEDFEGNAENMVLPNPEAWTIDSYRNLTTQFPNLIDARLMPVPYIGNLATGTVFIVMANPGLSPVDPFQEYADDENDPRLNPIRKYRTYFVEELKKNLKQEQNGVEYPFFYLNPLFNCFSGANYWLRSRSENGCQNLKSLIDTIGYELNDKQKIDEGYAQKLLARHLVVIQEMPYHSKRYPKGVHTPHYSRLLTYFLKDLFNKANNNEILLLLYRKDNLWNNLLTINNLLRPQAGEDRWISNNIWCVRERDHGMGAIGFGARGDLHRRIVEWVLYKQRAN